MNEEAMQVFNKEDIGTKIKFDFSPLYPEVKQFSQHHVYSQQCALVSTLLAACSDSVSFNPETSEINFTFGKYDSILDDKMAALVLSSDSLRHSQASGNSPKAPVLALAFLQAAIDIKLRVLVEVNDSTSIERVYTGLGILNDSENYMIHDVLLNAMIDMETELDIDSYKETTVVATGKDGIDPVLTNFNTVSSSLLVGWKSEESDAKAVLLRSADSIISLLRRQDALINHMNSNTPIVGGTRTGSKAPSKEEQEAYTNKIRKARKKNKAARKARKKNRK